MVLKLSYLTHTSSTKISVLLQMSYNVLDMYHQSFNRIVSVTKKMDNDGCEDREPKIGGRARNEETIGGQSEKCW